MQNAIKQKKLKKFLEYATRFLDVCVIIVFQLNAQLIVLDSFESRVDAMAKAVFDAGIVSKADVADLRLAAKSFCQKLTIADAYKPASTLTTAEVHLIRASQSHRETEGLGHDYGLATICTKPVTVDTIDGAHNTFILGEGAAKIQEILNKTLL